MPSAPDAPSGRDASAADGPEPAREQGPAEDPPQQDDQQDAEQDAAEQPADEAVDALEPVLSPAKAKKPAKPRKEQASEKADKPAITPGSRDRKKVEHYKPPEAPTSKTATTVQEVRLMVGACVVTYACKQRSQIDTVKMCCCLFVCCRARAQSCVTSRTVRCQHLHSYVWCWR